MKSKKTQRQKKRIHTYKKELPRRPQTMKKRTGASEEHPGNQKKLMKNL